MQNYNCLNQMNFKVKTSSSETFLLNEHDLDVQIFLNVVNMVSSGELEHYVECCNHDAKEGV